MNIYFISGSYTSSDGKGNYYTGFCNTTINTDKISSVDLDERTLVEIFEIELEKSEHEKQGNTCSCVLISYQKHNTEIGYQANDLKEQK